MHTVAAIDVGSNAVRLAIARADRRGLEVVENVREPIRLGHDVFGKGAISSENLQRLLAAFQSFQSLNQEHGVQRCRAVATSALREAQNRDLVISSVAEASGLEISLISGEEEARLVHRAVASRVELHDKLALLIDIGGGSVEIILADSGHILAAESFRMGTVRLLQLLGDPRSGEQRFHRLLREYVDATRRRLELEIGHREIDLGVGTGGNVESLGDLRHDLLGKARSQLKASELDTLIEELLALTYEERVRKLGLRPDRADVIVPAAIVLQKVLKQAGVGELLIPNVGVKDGVLLDLLEDLHDETRRRQSEQVLQSALQLGRKYAFDEAHGTTVARFAVQLFDNLRPLHKLPDDARLLLETAALLHDIGHFVQATAHHKHALYLILNSPLIGLDPSQQAIIANVARYHRKAAPSLRHEEYQALSPKERVVVTKLAALLRLADALDKENARKVKDLRVTCNPAQVTLQLQGEGDLLLERWALVKNAALFEEVFGTPVTIAE